MHEFLHYFDLTECALNLKRVHTHLFKREVLSTLVGDEIDATETALADDLCRLKALHGSKEIIMITNSQSIKGI